MLCSGPREVLFRCGYFLSARLSALYKALKSVDCTIQHSEALHSILGMIFQRLVASHDLSEPGHEFILRFIHFIHREAMRAISLLSLASIYVQASTLICSQFKASV